MKNFQAFLLLLIVVLISSCSESSNDTGSPVIDDRDKFTGVWSCKETIGSTVLTFNITINKVGSDDSISIENFSGLGSTAVAGAYVSSSSITIPNQKISVTNIIVQGSGVYSNSAGSEKISLNYITDGQSASATCTPK